MDDCVGTSIPFTVSDFQAKYLPVPSDFDARYPNTQIDKIRKAFKRKISTLQKGFKAKDSPTTERPEEKVFVQAWDDMNKEFNLFPGYIFHTSKDSPEVGDTQQYKCDATLIAEIERDNIVAGKPNWALSRLPIEFKRGGREHDPFDDREDHEVETTVATRRRVRGQLMSYARKVCSYQHRTKLFQLFVNGEEFRMLRWDRSGPSFTPSINYLEGRANMRLLLQLLYGFARLDSCKQGLDHTAVPLPKESCGWRRMDVLAFPMHHDLPHDERSLSSDFSPPAGFDSANADPPISSLFHSKHLHQDPLASCDPSTDHCSLPAPDALSVWVYVRQFFRDSLDANYPRYQITLNGRRYLVGRPVFENNGMIGRATRGYVALEWETQRFVFLKDAWRPYYDGVEQEGTVLEKLNEKGVSRVPTLVTHGDVYEVDGTVQETETSKYAPAPQKTKGNPAPNKQGRKIAPIPASRPGSKAGVTPPPIPASMPEAHAPSQPRSDGSSRGVKRSAEDTEVVDKAQKQRPPGYGLRHFVHYRIVVVEICLPSTAFRSGRMWARIVWHCLQAHQQAYEKCSLIHRDISVGNILILPTIIVTQSNACGVFWTGVLTDWELAKDITMNFARQPERTGTWQFMSLRCISHPTLPVSIPDELESCLHVLLYNGVRFLLHNFQQVHSFVHDYFDQALVDTDDVHNASSVKRNVVTTGRVVSGEKVLHFEMPEDVPGEHPMNELVERLLRLFSARYRVLAWEAEQAALKAAQVTRKTALPPVPSVGDDDKDLDDLIEQTPFSARRIEKRPASRPTIEEVELNESLKTHHTVVDIFAEIVQTAKWPKKKDVVDDRLFGYKSAPRVKLSTQDKPPKQIKTAPVGGPSARLAKVGRTTVKAKMDVFSE